MYGKTLFAAAFSLLLTGFSGAVAGETAPVVWTFGDLSRIGGAPAHTEGAPRHILTPAGPAVAFDGKNDAIFVDAHPLAGAKTFTFEAIFRPDGGAFAQRWFHLAETNPKTGEDSGARMLFEIRVVGSQWYLDTFVKGPGYAQALIVPEKTFPVGPWYHVAQTYDGHVYRSYVNGVLQAEAKIDFKPQGPGRSSIGVRINRVNYFHGAVLSARFTPRALTPSEFQKVPASLNAPVRDPQHPAEP